MAYVKRGDVAIYYEAQGEGPAILLTHGFAATGRMWSRQLDLLTKNFKVIVWDLRGHGRSDSPDNPDLYSQEQTLGDMLAILDAANAPQAIVGGHSLGGYMSLAFNARYAERVKALLLCGCGPGYRKDEPRSAWNVSANKTADSIKAQGLDFMRGLSAEMLPEDHKSVDGLVKAARGILTQKDAVVIESLPSISVPTFISIGSNDKSFMAGTEYLEAKIPGAVRFVFEGAGHAANYDAADEFNAALGSFLEKNAEALRA